jgi:hypothetical protein
MKTLIVTLLFAAVTFAQSPQEQPQQQQPQQQPSGKRTAKSGQARRAGMKKLQADLDQAAARAKFTDEQRQQFDAARKALRDQAERRRGKGSSETATADRESARQAMRNLRGLVSSEAFQPEDRELLRKDLNDLRRNAGRNRQGNRNSNPAPKPAA